MSIERVCRTPYLMRVRDLGICSRPPWLSAQPVARRALFSGREHRPSAGSGSTAAVAGRHRRTQSEKSIKEPQPGQQTLPRSPPAAQRRVHGGYRLLTVSSTSSLSKQGVDVVVGTPGRINELMAKGSLQLKRCSAVVLDEVDILLGKMLFHNTPRAAAVPASCV